MLESARRRLTGKQQKLNSALLTAEEAQQPMGLRLLMAGTRLGVKYLDGSEPILPIGYGKPNQ